MLRVRETCDTMCSVCVHSSPSSDHPECASRMQYTTKVHIAEVRMGTSEGGQQKEFRVQQPNTCNAEQVPISVNYRKLPLLTNMKKAMSNKAQIESDHSNNGSRNHGNDTFYTDKSKCLKMIGTLN